MTKQELNEAYNAIQDAELLFRQKAAEYINQIDYTLIVPFEFMYEKTKHNITDISNGIISGITEHKYYMDYTKVCYTMSVDNLISVLPIEQINDLLNQLK